MPDSDADKETPGLERLATGLPALDSILGGGFPVGSTNMLVGGPGAGKSVLALQIAFHQARLGQKVAYFTTAAEPALKFVYYVRQFPFFDPSLLDNTFFLLDLSGPALSEGVEKAFDTISQQVSEHEPVLVVVDSFKVLRDRLTDPVAARSAIYDLVVRMGVWRATTLLVGEYTPDDLVRLPEFYAADGIIQLATTRDVPRVARTLEVLKLRGTDYVSGQHYFAISPAGVVIYPRARVPVEEEEVGPVPSVQVRLAMGIKGLDEMLGGGLPVGSSTALEGGTGTGKTLVSLTFLMEGARRGEPSIMFSLEESRRKLFAMATARGWDLADLERRGVLRIVRVQPLDLAADALLRQVADTIQELGAKRVVVDSLSALTLSIAGEGRSRELVYALIKILEARGVTSVLTVEVPELLGSTTLTGRGLSSIADNIILMRYVEIESRLTQAVSVLKVRGSAHSRVLLELEITSDSIQVGEPFLRYRGVLTGVPTPTAAPGMPSGDPGPRTPRAESKRKSGENT